MNKNFSGNKPKKGHTNHKDKYLQEAQEAVDIVNKGLKKGSFSQMTERLNKLSRVDINRDKYVFECNQSAANICGMVVCVILTIWCLRYVPVYLGTMIYSSKYRISAFIGGILLVLHQFTTFFIKKYRTGLSDV